MKDNFWRPFTQEANAIERIDTIRAKDSYLYDKNGKKYVDLISSWWVITHGHCNPNIVSAIKNQLKNIDHLAAGDFAEEQSIMTIKLLKQFLDKSFLKFFFSDNGSTSVEVALKIAYQYHVNNGDKKKYFLAFQGGYHGDTFGAMSVGGQSGFFEPFQDTLLKNVLFIDFPATWEKDDNVESKENKAIVQFKDILKKHKDDIIGFILEPIVQGASGMRYCRPEFLDKICKIGRENDILLIFDEVMTGFNRTGKMFAYQHISVVPDIICLSKGITGGFFPLGVTATSEKIYQSFFSKDSSKTFLHGHSYTANPIICSAAVANLKLFTDAVLNKVQKIESYYKKYITSLESDVQNIRIIGNICAFDLNEYVNIEKLKRYMLNKGFFLRPLGRTVYFIPPFCIKEIDILLAFDQINFFLRK